MKKLLTFILTLVAVILPIGLGAAQQERQEQPGGALLAERLNLAAIDSTTNEPAVPLAPAVMATKACTCVASVGGWNSKIIYNYGVIANYPILDVMAPRKCSQACSDLVSGKSNIGDATAMCANTGWAGGCVHGYGYIGSIGTNNVDGTAGKLVCTAPVAAVTQQKCPSGWISNTNSQDGGVTTDGHCKKGACGPNSIAPYPPDGTPIGTWGFTWGNGFYAWGNSANGGGPVTINISPAKPGSGIWSTCP